jgi:hypothetical protein
VIRGTGTYPVTGRDGSTSAAHLDHSPGFEKEYRPLRGCGSYTKFGCDLLPGRQQLARTYLAGAYPMAALRGSG